MYAGNRLTKRVMGAVLLRIATAFPDMPKGKQQLILEMMHDEGFTEQRAVDAVQHVIKEHTAWGKDPHVGNFISFDRRVKVLSGSAASFLVSKGELAWPDLAIVRIESVSGCRSAGSKSVMFVRKSDAEKYGVATREPKPYGHEWPD